MVVIKDKEQVALERFIFSVESMIEVEAFNKDTRSFPFLSGWTQIPILCFFFLSVEDAMSGGSLGQYFRSFLVKLNMVESQLGQMDLGGEHDRSTRASFSKGSYRRCLIRDCAGAERWCGPFDPRRQSTYRILVLDNPPNENLGTSPLDTCRCTRYNTRRV